MKLDVEQVFKIYSIKYKKEHRFHPVRKWRFDYILLPEDLKIAVEYEGGIFTGGRHTKGNGYAKDCEKYNAAVLMGWRILRYTVDVLEKNPEKIAHDIIELRDKKNED